MLYISIKKAKQKFLSVKSNHTRYSVFDTYFLFNKHNSDKNKVEKAEERKSKCNEYKSFTIILYITLIIISCLHYLKYKN